MSVKDKIKIIINFEYILFLRFSFLYYNDLCSHDLENVNNNKELK